MKLLTLIQVAQSVETKIDYWPAESFHSIICEIAQDHIDPDNISEGSFLTTCMNNGFDSKEADLWWNEALKH